MRYIVTETRTYSVDAPSEEAVRVVLSLAEGVGELVVTEDDQCSEKQKGRE
jgi:hypothetical protein